MIDHLVYAVADLDTALDDFEQRTGVRPTYGGQHIGLGTHNAVLDLGNAAYVELLAPDPSQPESSGPLAFGIDALDQPKLVTWAAKAGNLRERVDAARRAGFDPGDVVPISRRLPDGGLLQWQLTHREPGPAGDGLVPYLIDWGDVPHPTTRATPGCRLVEFRAEHPDSDSVQTMLDAIDVSLPVEMAPTPALVAIIDSPNGTITLR